MAKQERDWTKTGTVQGMAEWLLTQSDAICVLVIRPHDSVFAVDPRCAPKDAGELIAERLPLLLDHLDFLRDPKKRAMRQQLERCME